MKKKTIPVVPVINWGNKQLRRTDGYATKEFKSGVCSMIEKVLHEADRYEGFCFMDADDSKFDTLGYFTRKYFVNHFPGEEMDVLRYMARANDGFDVLIIKGTRDTKIITVEYPDGRRSDVNESYLSYYSTLQDPTDHGFAYIKKLKPA